MIKIPDSPLWRTESAIRTNYREGFSRLTQAVQSTLSGADQIYTKKKAQIIAWKRSSAWRMIGCGGERLANHYRFELSFGAEDLPQVAVPSLVRFVESTYEHHDPWQLTKREASHWIAKHKEQLTRS